MTCSHGPEKRRNPTARIRELEAALVGLLGAVKQRSAWDYSDVYDEVLDAEHVLAQRGKGAPLLVGRRTSTYQSEPVGVAGICFICGAPRTAHKPVPAGWLCPRYEIPVQEELR